MVMIYTDAVTGIRWSYDMISHRRIPDYASLNEMYDAFAEHQVRQLSLQVPPSQDCLPVAVVQARGGEGASAHKRGKTRRNL